MQHCFVFKSKPFSINASTYGDARTKTSAYYEWASKIFHQMWSQENQEKFKELREHFDENLHSVSVQLTSIYPKEIYITKAGILSSKTQDISNTEKLILDLLFDERFHTREHPNGAPNCNINDKHVVEMISSKKYHDGESLLEINISIIPRAF